MADSPVNIADFRCRGIKLRVHQHPLGSINTASGITLLHARPEVPNHQPEVHKEVATAEFPGVVDIARASQRMHPCIALRAPSPQRYRSNVVRFNEPRVAVMRVHEPRQPEHLADDYDFPPAA